MDTRVGEKLHAAKSWDCGRAKTPIVSNKVVNAATANAGQNDVWKKCAQEGEKFKGKEGKLTLVWEPGK